MEIFYIPFCVCIYGVWLWYKWSDIHAKLLFCFDDLKPPLAFKYTCQLSRPRVENFHLTPAHAWGPISHAWLKNVSCCHLARHNFQKYVNSDPCQQRKPCVKWINDNTFLAISDFVDKRFLNNFAFGRLRTSSGIFGNDRVVFKSPCTPRIKISRLYLRKSWQV